jgi:hypothetical protein
MAIPESKLAIWSHQGSITNSSKTYTSIKVAIDTWEPLLDKDHDVYLQGSYKNDTNIFGESDVDVVVQLNSCWQRDISSMPLNQQQQYLSSHFPAPYSWKHFHTDALNALTDYYGGELVKPGTKAIKVTGISGRLNADVVVCVQYRKYGTFYSYDNQQYQEGIAIWVPKYNEWIINYPKIHYINGCAKHTVSDKRYKSMVRIFKNAANELEQRGLLADGVAPSYFIECLTFNAPYTTFDTSYQGSFVRILGWIVDAFRYDSHTFMQANEIVPLFGMNGEKDRWNRDDAITLIRALGDLWDTW